MKVLQCSECWLPRERKSSYCRKCILSHQQANFQKAIESVDKRKELHISILQKQLSRSQLSELMLLAIFKDHPIQEFKQMVWPEIVHQIRFHHEPHSLTCSAVRKLIDQNLFHEIIVPEECCECLYTFVSRAYAQYSNLAIGQLFYSSETKLKQVFKIHLKTKGGRESLLNYINFMLWISNSFEHMTPTASKRVIDMLLESVEIHHPTNKQWILEELVSRPENYQYFLCSPPRMPGNYTETMFDYFTDFEVWWNFWQRVNVSVRKKIEFRSLTLKDELMMKTWKPERVREWCLDIEDLHHIESHFAR